ncbi:hypothetical protein FOZ60_001097 [Perkinsus olseni]|uniref:Secreted protein n=1 Tax=Perkinsus olseni TaxID=32597 RepID=A0A7J6P135_PEROL|nr:hypothetical protein FOZ60_001097 [Perkinsus olseni]
MTITLRYLISTILLVLPVVAQQQPNNQDPPFVVGTGSLPPLGPITGEVNSLWVWLAAQVQSLASSLEADLSADLAAVAQDSEHPFWAWLKSQMENDPSSLAINDTVIQPVLDWALDKNEDPYYVWLAAEVFANSRAPTTGDTDPSLRRRAIEAKPRPNPVLEWLEAIFDAFRLF